jgi:fructokinase
MIIKNKMHFRDLKVVCFGEVLFDVFPSYKKIGGAPLNVAFRLASFGVDTTIISRIGADELGKEILAFCVENNIDCAFEEDKNFKTGRVTVKLDPTGGASYTIDHPVAWDKIESTPFAETKVENSDALVFGSLVCRDAVSHQTMLHLLKKAKFKVLDVNLRKPYYSYDLINELMQKADFIKCNDEELIEICSWMQAPFQDIEHAILFIAEQTKTIQICVTRGSKGAVLYSNGHFLYNTGYPVKVVDTVGAGDSFLAGLIYSLLSQKNHQEALDFACAVGALVARHEGANPIINAEDIEKLIKTI